MGFCTSATVGKIRSAPMEPQQALHEERRSGRMRIAVLYIWSLAEGRGWSKLALGHFPPAHFEG